jgi:RecB family endonuclease NucS
MPHKSHYVITPSENGQALQSPLKQWVRQNLDNLPQGFYEEDDTSHILRRKLRDIGWRLNITDNAVFVIKPDDNNKFDYAEDFVEEIIEEEENDTEDTEEAIEITFSLERDLQAALRKNIETLEQGLKIIDGGKERNTVAGRIDITAQDKSNKIVVIELKAIEAKPDVIAQVLAYMEAVKEEDKKETRGIIVASGFTERVKLAARQINHLKLVQYSFKFNFNIVE